MGGDASTTSTAPAAAMPAHSSPRSLGGFDVVVSVLTAASFAVAGPVLEVLGHNADVFAARRSPPADVVAAGLAVAVVVPLALALLVGAVHRLHRRVGTAVHAVALTALLAVLVVQPLDRQPGVAERPALLLALAVVAAAGVTVLYRRSSALRSFTRLGVVAPVGFFLLFVFFTPAGDLLADEEEAAAVAVGNPAPVVFVVFDGLPLVSLLDAERGVDAALFPSFARLAETSTWFRNATVHSASTREALPAMLTGRRVIRGEDDASGNLFELLPASYRTTAFEPFLPLCPEERCASSQRREPRDVRWRRLARDVALLGAHALAPGFQQPALPPVENVFGAFAGGEVDEVHHRDHAAHVEAWERFLVDLEPDGQPAVHFFHWMKPHFPWTHLPTGQASAPLAEEPHGGYVHMRWEDDWLRIAQWQRQLLQIGYVDRLLGELLDAMEDAGVADEALLIVASDHGEAFTPDEKVRVPAAGNLGELAFVTLFIREPGQTAGDVSDAPVEVVDLLPTVLDVLDADPPGPLEGRSLRGELPSNRTRTIRGWDEQAAISSSGHEVSVALDRKLERFGAEGGWERLFDVGPHGRLVGAAVDDLPRLSDPAAQVAILDLERFGDVQPGDEVVPNLLRGQVRADVDLSEPLTIAIALNGRIATVAETYGEDGPHAELLVVLPPDALRAGRNDLAVLEVVEVDGAPALRPLPVAQP